MSIRLEALLTVAATAVAIAFFASVPHWPKEWTTRTAPIIDIQAALRGPQVLSGLGPVPDYNLKLPDDIAVITARRGINGETGLIPTVASITTFRILGTTDLVTVAMVEGAEPIRAPATLPDNVLRVHGHYAVAVVDRGVTRIRWTENSITFDIASRTLEAPRLAEIANKLQ